VVDFQLPGKNGVELLRCLREKSVATPAILISGNIDDEFNSAIVDLEDVVTLRKPCSVDVFLQTIERIAG
jgi:DNA-binding NarL/FixJ family response regulator